MSASIELVKLRDHIYSLDVRGLVCPYPELLTLKAIQTLSISDTLELLIDNPPSVRDIPLTIEKRGLTAKTERLGSGTWKLIIRI